MEVIKTSDNDWLEVAIEMYSQKQSFHFIDDANIGFTQSDLQSAINLLSAVKKKTNIPWKQITAVLISIGISGTGIWMIIVAIADPEPTSKLSILLAGGVLLAMTGGLGALRALGYKWIVKTNCKGFTITPD